MNNNVWPGDGVWPDPMSVELRTQRLHIRMTPTEHRAVADAARSSGTTVAQFVRALIVREAAAVNAEFAAAESDPGSCAPFDLNTRNSR